MSSPASGETVWRVAATGWYDRTSRENAITAVPAVAARRAARAGATTCGSGPAPLAVILAATTVTATATSPVTTRICRPEAMTPASWARKR